ncbi:hypothetical protein [Vibrio porteresiae]|uniref:Uncharacterized protein n=1 Tax=Vibrio porteresiae DSM 19223 TaxID=1123496 RepID=A0ABZ0QKF8_9VIBR|nr:hypothetical protein [Vibrio porteresiae]WPC75903.1 hypothetical protein R8Z52_23605 [Vibrio porteresiae DSM 19223]
MANIKSRRRNEKFLRILNGLGSILSLGVGSIIQLDLSSSQINQYPFLKYIVLQIKAYAPALLIVAVILLVVTYVLLKCSSSVAILKCLQAKLDVLRGWICCDLSGDFDDNHRVTLFQYKSTYFGLAFRKKYWACKYFPWSLTKTPWSGWLVPVARSGYTNQKGRSVFWAPDSGRNAEGVVGIAWAKGGDMVHFEKLPKITKQSSSQNRCKYCDCTKISPLLLDRYIETGTIPARSFLAFSLLVDAEPWGVVVVDSQSAQGIDVTQIDRVIENTCSLVPILLEEL